MGKECAKTRLKSGDIGEKNNGAGEPARGEDDHTMISKKEGAVATAPFQQPNEPTLNLDKDVSVPSNESIFTVHSGTPYYMVPGSTRKMDSLALEDWYAKKFVPSVAVTGVAKTLTVISSDFKKYKPIWLMNIAPSRQLKTITSEAQEWLFKRGRVVRLRSDFTMLSLFKNYHEGKDLNSRCLCINDLTLLLSSKSDRAKDRLINGLAEIASEGEYEYSDFSQRVLIKFRASLIGNITLSSYMRNHNTLFENTFTNRCLNTFHEVSLNEQTIANTQRDTKDALKCPRLVLKLKEKDICITALDIEKFNAMSMLWAELGEYTSTSPVFDIIKSLAVAYAILEGSTTITKENYAFLGRLEQHIGNPLTKQQTKILRLAKAGASARDIHDTAYPNDTDGNRMSWIYEVIKRYRRSGILPIDGSSDSEAQ